MICEGCTSANRPAKGSPMAGYCDACGWALVVVAGRETSRLHQKNPLAQLVVGLAEAEITYSDTGVPERDVASVIREIAEEKSK